MVVKKKPATVAKASGKASAKIIDFSNVKDRGNFNPKNIEPGDYIGTITKVEQTEAKDGEDMWVFTFELDGVPRATYPHYCKLVDTQFWKIKALFEAAGISVGKRKAKVDPNRLVGKSVGVGIEDDEYEGRVKSTIVDVFPEEDVHDSKDDEDPEEDDLEEDDIEEEPAPKKRAKKKPEPEEEEEEEDDDEEEEEDEDDEEEEDEEPEPPKKKRAPAKKAPAKKATAKKKRPVDDDDEDEEDLDIDEL